jgi:uncharacterized protein (DUF2384 family)
MDADDASRTLSPHEVELSAIRERLAQVIGPEYIPLWLDTPVPALGDQKPIDLVARREWQPLEEMIAGLESPGFS